MRIVFFTHGNRMKCILRTYFVFETGETWITKTSENLLEKDFNNCAVLKLIFQGNACMIEVIWEGGLTRQQVGGKDYADASTGTYEYKGKAMPEGQVFYMIRHGEGFHNKAKAEGTKWRNFDLTDARLTDHGKAQAELAGQKLAEDLAEDGYEGRLVAFVSDLRRTHETAAVVLPQQKIYYVLPCLFELAGGCDDAWINHLPSQENKSLRFPSYRASYATNPNSRNANCTTTNVFEAALDAVGTLSGGTKRRRRRKRTSKVRR